MHFAGSSNGRTTDSGSVYLGSNPSPAAIRLTLFAHGHGQNKRVECPERTEGFERVKRVEKVEEQNVLFRLFSPKLPKSIVYWSN